MTLSDFEKKFACPRCKTALHPKKTSSKCSRCKFEYFKKDSIWHFLHVPKRKTQASLEIYDLMHKKFFGGPNDGSYKVLATIARGNKTIDIACGQGLIEKLAPETVGVEFSINALKKARVAGAVNLVLANAHNLPFVDNSFDVSISSGNLEHFENPQKAINEMARISKIQIMTVHREFDWPLSSFLRKIVTQILKVKNQPIEKPIKWAELELMLKKAKLHIVFKGFWTLPVNFGNVARFLPVFKKIPSSFFVITIKK